MKELNRMCVTLYLTAQAALGRLRDDESGMEVMQVVLLLGAGIVVIMALIGFGSQITGGVGGQVTDVLDALGG